MKNYNIKNKADAMAFAITNANGDLDKAMRIYNMFVNNIFSDKQSLQTIIFPNIPHLEWMTENLQGYGGTEIDGRWYYTWEEAMAAVKQLGDGWRLPTQEEFRQLNVLGRTWDNKRKGRWFGGNHNTNHEGSLFLDAAGNINGAYLNFNSGNVNPLNNTSRANGLSVRCVRTIK